MATFITTMRFTEHQTLGRLALVNLGRRHKPDALAPNACFYGDKTYVTARVDEKSP